MSQKFTHKIGSRSLDILHVAVALSIKADKFLTFDEKQAELVSLTSLELINIELRGACSTFSYHIRFCNSQYFILTFRKFDIYYSHREVSRMVIKWQKYIFWL